MNSLSNASPWCIGEGGDPELGQFLLEVMLLEEESKVVALVQGVCMEVLRCWFAFVQLLGFFIFLFIFFFLFR